VLQEDVVQHIFIDMVSAPTPAAAAAAEALALAAAAALYTTPAHYIHMLQQ
jgi:hypothetical protein